jgi:23S rRNA pseudoU1915 N3-methylase RlmH
MLGTLENKEKQDWKKYISSLVHAYNCTKHDSTGYSPYELMFGRKPRLPVDLAFGLPEEHNQTESYSEYITDLRNRIKETFELVKNTAESSRQKQKINFDKRAKAKKLSIGDQVLLKILAYDGKHKIADKFEETIYSIKSQPNADIPVYVIIDEEGQEKTIHRNLSIPI